MASSNYSFEHEDQQPYHALTTDLVLSSMQSSERGLSYEEADQRLAKHGKNVPPQGTIDSFLSLILRQVNNPLIWVLIVSGFIAMLADPIDGVKNGIVILGVVFLNTIVGFTQEFKATKAIKSLGNMAPESANVLRDGKKVTISAHEIVPGDIVFLASGDKVPADMRLFDIRSLRVDEAMLTGESVPAEKSIIEVDENASIGDRKNMVFGGTLVTYGTGTALVVRTGENTELGRIGRMLKETTELETPLTHALKVIGQQISISILVIATTMLIIGTLRSMHITNKGLLEALLEQAIFAIALAVGAIPEGLPAIITIALAIGVQRMALRNAIVRKLPAVETLGSTTIICSDKTGTLTRNEMTVQAIWTSATGAYEVSGLGYEPKGSFTNRVSSHNTQVPALDTLLTAGALCNDSNLSYSDDQWKPTGDPTEAALLVSASKYGLNLDILRMQNKRIDTIPFESENQFMATLNIINGEAFTYIKGAPEVIINSCKGIDLETARDEVENMTQNGMRVLGFCRKRMPNECTKIEIADIADGCEFLGLQGMIDPPRVEAIEAINACHNAGITVKMITGDHQGTAAAIGKKLGLITEQQVMTGALLSKINDEDLKAVANSTNVFARVAPEDKLRLVKALQAQNQIVAMTGDGVNDAPALKQSNIGVAMGITGTAVSKEAADIVLTDDNFSSIAAAIEEGRRVYDNLIKSLAFVLPTNLGLALILMAAVLFFPFVLNAQTGQLELLLPILPTQLLWINLVSTIALALPLAFEAKEPDVMRRTPRNPNAPVLSTFIILRTILAALLMASGAIIFFLYEYYSALNLGVAEKIALSKAQTLCTTTVVIFQVFYFFNCRSLKDSIFSIGIFSNKTVFIGIFALLILQLSFIYSPLMHNIFNTSPLSTSDLFKSLYFGAIVLPIISLEKLIYKRAQSKNLIPKNTQPQI